jgi:molybdate transport system permease protein
VSWQYFHPWLLSLQVAGVAILINAATAIPLSYLLARKRFAGRWILESAVILPLVLPPTVIGFLLMYPLGKHGPWYALTGNGLLFTVWAEIIASAIVSFPLVVLPVRAAFAAIPKEYDEEGRMAGLALWQRFLYIALPTARGAILSGLLLGFARALGEFGATMMLVGTLEHTRTLPIQIYYDAGLTGDLSAAWPAVGALGLTSVAVILIANRLRWLDAER